MRNQTNWCTAISKLAQAYFMFHIMCKNNSIFIEINIHIFFFASFHKFYSISSYGINVYMCILKWSECVQSTRLHNILGTQFDMGNRTEVQCISQDIRKWESAKKKNIAQLCLLCSFKQIQFIQRICQYILNECMNFTILPLCWALVEWN